MRKSQPILAIHRREMFWLFLSFLICFYEKKNNTEKGHWKISQNNGNITFKNIPIVLLKKGKTQFKEK